MLILKMLVFIGGVWLVLWTVTSALRSFVLPRSDRAFLTIGTFKVVYKIMTLRFTSRTSFAAKDRMLAMLAPIAMFLLPLIWLALITVGYAGFQG